MIVPPEPIHDTQQRRERSWTRRPAAYLAVFGLAVPVAAYFWFIHQYGVNTIWFDQWEDVSLISHSYSHSLTFGTLWAQHNENRIFFPNLIVLLLARTTGFNIVLEQYLSGLMLVVATGLLILTHHRRSPSTPWFYYSPVVIVMLTFAQAENTLWGFQMAWYLVIFALALALFLLDRPNLNQLALTGAISAAILGSFSSLQGLLIWPVGLVLLYLRGRSKGSVFIWIVSAAATATVYFYNFAFHTTNAKVVPSYQDYSFSFHHPVAALKFLFFLIGDIVSLQTSTVSGPANGAVVVFGIVIVAIGIWVVVSYGRQRDQDGGGPIGVALVCYGLLFAATVTLGRGALGLGTAGRYTPFVLLIPVGSYLTLCDRPEALPEAKSPGTFLQVIRATLVGAICIQAVFGIGNGLAIGRKWHQSQLLAADVTVNIDLAPNDLVERTLLPSIYLGGYVRELTLIAKTHHLSLFATNAVALYTKEGLPAYHTPPRTDVVLPSPGTTMKGYRFLNAGASDNFGVTKTSRGSGPSRVEFHVTASGLGAPIIIPSTHFVYGWLGAWDTRTVPDGTYTLQSVAYDVTGKATYSAGILVKVEN